METDKRIADEDAVVPRVVPGTLMVATLEEFVERAYPREFPKDAANGLPLGLRLGIEKFKLSHNQKYYHLVWLGRGHGALAAERPEAYRRKMDAILGGYVLAEETGAHFDTRTR
jgi:hypothetical protein